MHRYVFFYIYIYFTLLLNLQNILFKITDYKFYDGTAFFYFHLVLINKWYNTYFINDSLIELSFIKWLPYSSQKITVCLCDTYPPPKYILIKIPPRIKEVNRNSEITCQLVFHIRLPYLSINLISIQIISLF